MAEIQPKIRAKGLENCLSVINKGFEKKETVFIALFIAAGLLFFAGLGKRHLWGADEPREAGIAADMARTGDFVVPRLNGEPFLEKPPLYSFAAAIALRLLGESTYAVRIIAAISAFGCVIILFFLARAMNLTLRGAFLSGFALATSVEFWNIGRKNMIDMTLCFFITAAMASFYQTTRLTLHKSLWYILFVVSLSCAVVTKGLVGLAVPLSALVVFLIAQKTFSLRSWAGLFAGAILSCIPFFIWILLLYNRLGYEAVYEAFWRNNIGRFTGGYAQHVEPFYYYLMEFPGQFLPWTLFLPLGIILLIRDFRKNDGRFSSRFILSWLIIPFILLSISAGKRGLYLLPIYPAAALAAGFAADSVLSGREKSSLWFEIPASILAGIAVVSPIVLLIIRIYYHQSYIIMILITITGFCLGLIALLLCVKKNFRSLFHILVPSFVMIFLSFDMAIQPIFNQKESFEPLFKYAGELDSRGFTLGLLKPNERLDGAVVFYLKKRIKRFSDFEAAREFLSKNEDTVIITKKENVEQFSELRIITSFNIGRYTLVILSNKTPAEEI